MTAPFLGILSTAVPDLRLTVDSPPPTGEHGIGVVKKAWLEATRGADAVRAMRAIKAALDPLGILNPGKMLEVPLPSRS
jgi:hypothetical protein